jgi:hypothetical protein
MPAEFPLPSVSSSNPVPLFFEMQPEEFVVGKTVYDDNGADYRLQNGGNGIKRWIVKYDGLTSAEAAILDNWAASMFYSPDEGSAYGANFRDRDTTTLYSGVHIAPGGFRKAHTKLSAQQRDFLLEKRP